MDFYDLEYLEKFNIIIYKDHGYCLNPKAIEHYLRRLYIAKGSALATALDEIYSSDFLLKSLTEVVFIPQLERPQIPQLPCLRGFQYIFPDCELASDLLNPSRRAIEKHQNRLYIIGKGKANKRQL